jgi:hypothetical protein
MQVVRERLRRPGRPEEWSRLADATETMKCSDAGQPSAETSEQHTQTAFGDQLLRRGDAPACCIGNARARRRHVKIAPVALEAKRLQHLRDS